MTALAGTLNDADVGMRVCAIEALGRIGPSARAATASLIGQLRRLPAGASAAARALGRIGPGAKAAATPLQDLRHDPKDYVRQAAEEALTLILPGEKGR